MANQQTVVDKDGVIDGIFDEEFEDAPGVPAKLSDKILQGLDDEEVSMTVLRRTKGKKTAFLFELDEYEDMPTLLTLLRDEYGGGDFIIEGKNQKGQWVFKQSITVEAPIKKDESNHQNTGDFQSVLLAMQDASRQSSEETRNLMMQMQNQQMEAMRSNMEMMVRMMEANKPVEQPRQEFGPKEMVTMMASIKELMGNDEKDNTFETFLKGMEMGKEVGEGKDESILQTAIKSLGGPLAGLANMGQQIQVPAQSQVQPQVIAQPAQVTQTPEQELKTLEQQLPGQDNDTNVTEQEADPEMLQQMQLFQQFQPHLQTLVNAAASGGDPEVYANVILDQIDNETAAKFLAPEYYAKLFEFVPQIKIYKDWFDECREIVLELIKLDEGQDSGLENNELNQGDSTNDVLGEQSESNISPQTAPGIEQDSQNTE